MLRPLLLALATGLLGVSCALLEAPPPAGSVMVQLGVDNKSGRAVNVGVSGTMGGNSPMMPGSAQPSRVPPKVHADVRFFVPMTGDWVITVNGQDLIVRSDLRGKTGVIREIGIEVDEQGNTGWWCSSNCP